MPLPTASSLRDRTPEFLAIAERLSKQQGLSSTTSSSSLNGATTSSSGVDAARKQMHANSEFARKAADIGHTIHRTSVKLQKLAQLAKRTSMFDDPAQEVDELTGIIKQDIQALNSAIADLQRLSSRSRDENKQSQDHSHTVVDNLRSRLKDATQEFKDVLTVRTDNLKHHKERRGLFSSNTESESTLPLIRPRGSAGLQLGLGGGASSSSSSAQMPPAPSFMQSQQQLQLAAPQDTYLSSRAEALRNVENTIVELGTIFQKLSTMVAEQGEMAIRIDENIDDTLSNVTSAQEQLLKYLNNISSNRWLIMKVLFVLLVFLIIFIVFIA